MPAPLPDASAMTGLVARLRAAGCVYAEDEAELLLESASSPDQLERLVAQRVSGVPLEQVVGWAEFCGLRIVVGPGVFVPRRRTELLAVEAVALTHPRAVVVELCCGAGPVAAVLTARVADLEVYACDLDPVSVESARRNLPGAHVAVGDLFDPLPPALRGRVDVLVCNAPYVPTSAIAMLPAEAREHEALLALDGGADGLDILRRVVADASRWLSPRGHLLVESTSAQSELLVVAIAAAGLRARVVPDEDHDATVVIAAWPGILATSVPS